MSLGHFSSMYQALSEDEEQPLQEEQDRDDTEVPLATNIIVPEKNRSPWSHIKNLDDFFSRVYEFHQRSGFWCMAMADLYALLQFIFIILVAITMLNCVNYEFLNVTTGFNVTIGEIFLPPRQCVQHIGIMEMILIFVAVCVTIFKLFRNIYNFFKYLEIKNFYENALEIPAGELENLTWHEIQQKLLEAQKEYQMCIHKTELTQLDIYHRILRFKNYQVAMINKSLLPVWFTLPVLGPVVFLTQGLKFNFDLILFWGPWGPFENFWRLKSEYKSSHKRKELAEQLSRAILWIGLINLIFMFPIFLWQSVYSIFRYLEYFTNDPNRLGDRHWSLFARLDLRHFNELDHELQARLNRAHKPAKRYFDLFFSPLLVIQAKYAAFFSGVIVVSGLYLTYINVEVLHIGHYSGILAGATVVYKFFQGLIPDEHAVRCPELLMEAILAHIHYMPDDWKGKAHTKAVRAQFGHLFQYKIEFIVYELLSSLFTPFILLLSLRPRALQIVDFFRNFTVDVAGVGDVCSFAQMDVRRHGNPTWSPCEGTTATAAEQGEHGKVELSLMHFTNTNPEWKPPAASSAFLSNLKDHLGRDLAFASLHPIDNPLVNSLHSLTSMYSGYNGMISSMLQPIEYSHLQGSVWRGSGMRCTEGPIGKFGSNPGLLDSVHQHMSPTGSAQLTSTLVSENAIEHKSNEMSFGALYLHQVHRQRKMTTSRPSDWASEPRMDLDAQSRAICEGAVSTSLHDIRKGETSRSASNSGVKIKARGSEGGMPGIKEEWEDERRSLGHDRQRTDNLGVLSTAEVWQPKNTDSDC